MRINFSCRFLFPMVLKKDGCRASLRLPVLFLTHHGGLLSFGGMFFRLRAGVVDKVGAVYFSSPILFVVPSFGFGFPRLLALLPGVPPPRLRRPPLNEVNCSPLYMRLRARGEEVFLVRWVRWGGILSGLCRRTRERVWYSEQRQAGGKRESARWMGAGVTDWLRSSWLCLVPSFLRSRVG